MKTFQPDYQHIVQAARNIAPARLPLYEHSISEEIMESILNTRFGALNQGNHADRVEYFRQYCRFYQEMGYDTASYEYRMTWVMPGAGSLYGHKPGEITTRADFDRYPWAEIPASFALAAQPYFDALREAMPPGMKAIGGVGNGIFECVQDIVGYTDLCYIAADDPDLYAALFAQMGKTLHTVWQWLLAHHGDLFCVCRIGDDMGFKSATLLAPDDLRKHVLPPYRQIVQTVHQHGKPFLMHSCGNIFELMEDLITSVGIDAKHSNEDSIAPFPRWVEAYGDRIGNFGGIDTDAVCRLTRPEMKEYMLDVLRRCEGHGGFAFGSGNSIPDYVPVEGYLNMVDILREYRGDR